MTMKNPETTSVSFPILWQWQWRCFCYLSTFPHWIQTYGKVLCFGGTFADEEGKSAYAKLGLMHLFCLSGLHIAFVHAILRYVLLRLHCQRHRVIYIEAVVFIFLYVWTNGGIGIFRSSVMQLYHDVLEEREGKSNSYDAWGLALLLQLLWQPALLITSSGILSYAMSFFAFSLPCRTSQRWKHMMLYTVWTLPFLVYFFKQVHLLTPILNLILLPIFSVVVLPILAITLLCPLPIWVNSVEVVFQSWQGIITKLSQFHALPLAPLNIGCLLVYMMLLLCLYRGGRMRSLKIGVLCLFVLNQWHPWGQITMIDVGQGDSLFIRAPGAYHRACLIDCGGKVWSPSKTANATYTLIPFLKGQGVYELEHFFITHADDDHMGDMVEVAKAVRIRHLYFSQGCEKKEIFQRRLAQIKQLQPHIKVHPLLAPKQWQWHGITWQLLSPTEAGQGDNNHSLVFKISTPKRSFLLTGDLEKEGEQALMQHRIGPIDVLKVGHHGSKTATSQAWLEVLQPKQAWVSCGKHNRFHHPHDEVIQRLNRAHIPIYRTDQFGTIHYYFIGKLEKWVPTHAKNLIIEKTSTS